MSKRHPYSRRNMGKAFAGKSEKTFAQTPAQRAPKRYLDAGGHEYTIIAGRRHYTSPIRKDDPHA